MPSDKIASFREGVVSSKLALYALLNDIRRGHLQAAIDDRSRNQATLKRGFEDEADECGGVSWVATGVRD